MNKALTTLTNTIAARFDMGSESGQELATTLKNTILKGGKQQATEAQVVAFLSVANQYGLNPFVKEIYAFPDRGGIVPVVGVDGWSRIINSHPQFDGVQFEQDEQSCTCRIYRKDRSHPTEVTEWFSECVRGTDPWKSHPKRMLRHKALIQCARLAFGYTGIFDVDEAERIVERDMGTVEADPPAQTRTQSIKDKVRAQAAAAEPEPEPIDGEFELEGAPSAYELLVQDIGNCKSVEEFDACDAARNELWKDLSVAQQNTLTDMFAALRDDLGVAA